MIAKLRQAGQVRKQESVDEGVHVSGRFPQKQRALFSPFIITPTPKKKAAGRAKRKGT